MKWYAFISILLSLSVCMEGRGQGNTTERTVLQYAPTPKTLEMVRSAILGSEGNSGRLTFDIPIYEFSDKDFQVSVSLHYSSGGMRPGSPSGEAGLGWTLLCGGAITREIVGVDDFDTTFGHYGHSAGATDEVLYAVPANIGYNPSCGPFVTGGSSQSETSSDIYHFTMPGHSGSFVFKTDGRSFEVFGTADGRGRYEVEYVEGGKYFIIGTGDGYRYRFGKSDTVADSAKELMWQLNEITEESQARAFTDGELKTVTWLLDRITAPNGRTVDFIYESAKVSDNIPKTGDEVLTSFYRKQKSSNEDCGYKGATLTRTSYLRRVVIDSTLSDAVKRTVSFSWTRDTGKEVSANDRTAWTRLVVPKCKLSQIKVFEGGKCVRNTTLSYIVDGHRPLLTNVSTDGLGFYGFEYYTDPAHPLPGLLCNGVDFWDFYNGRDGNEDSAISPMSVDTNLDEYRTSAFMDPDSSYARLGMLRCVTWPTGGTTTVEYEANRASLIVLRRRHRLVPEHDFQPEQPVIDSTTALDPFLPSLNSIQRFLGYTQCGGIRVKTITDNDGLGGPPVVRSYSYENEDGSSSGIVQEFPRFYAGHVGSTDMFNPALKYPGSGFDALHVAYSRVTEHFADGSSIVNGFSDWAICPDEYSVHRQEYVTNLGFSEDYYAFLDNILREPDSRSYRRGLPASRVHLRPDGSPAKEERWTYSDYGEDYSAYIVGSGRYWWSARRFLCDRLPLSRTVSVFPDDGGAPQTIRTEYECDACNLPVYERDSCASGTKERATVWSGTLSQPDYGLLDQMRSDGIVAMPVVRSLWLNDNLVEAEKQTYRRLGAGHYVPEAVFSAPASPGTGSVNYRQTPDLTYERHDSLGNPLVISDRCSSSTVVWHPGGARPSAIFPNAADESVPHTTIQTSYESSTSSYPRPLTISKTFTSTAAGVFNATYTMSDLTQTDYTLYFKIDNGTERAVNCFFTSEGEVGVYSYHYASLSGLPAGTHTLSVRFARKKLPDDPVLPGSLSPNVIVSPTAGSLEISYAVTETITSYTVERNVLYEDFDEEGSGGTSDVGIGGSGACTGTFSRALTVHPGRTYVLDWMQKEGGGWRYHRTAFACSNVDTTIAVAGTESSPIDNVRFYPEGTPVTSWSWTPDGELAARTDARGVSEHYGYDARGMLTSVSDNDLNLVRSYAYAYTPDSPGDSSVSESLYLDGQGQRQRTITAAFDGLGRERLSREFGASGDGYNLTSWTQYDSCGRVSRRWLPFALPSSAPGSAADGVLLNASALTRGGDTLAFAHTAYEGWTDGRVVSLIGPGAAWHEAGRGETFALLSSRDTGVMAVHRLTVELMGNTGISIADEGLCDSGALLAERRRSADGDVSLTFTDAFGRKVLERIGDADTYYLYDGAGRLAAVLQPKLVAAMASSGWQSSSFADIDALAFQYRYDSRGRCIASKTPGAAWVYTIYDEAGRAVLTQDGNLRAAGKWRFSIADRNGNECLTGLTYGSWDAFSEPLDNIAVRAVPSNDYFALHGYSVEGLDLSNPELLTVRWWNGYDFMGAEPLLPPSAFAYDSTAVADGFGTHYSLSAQSLQTGALRRVLGAGNIEQYASEVVYYDWQGRPVQRVSGLLYGTVVTEDLSYDFAGNTVARRMTNRIGTAPAIVQDFTYGYDDWGRLLTATHSLDGSAPVTISSRTYDHCGRLSYDTRNAAPALATSYSYNTRDWLTQSATGQQGGTFLETLRYESGGNGGTSPAAPRWDGAVSRMEWRAAGDTVAFHAYDFGYDRMRRLTSADYSDSGAGLADSLSRSYSYDLNGNITSTGLVYDGNRIAGGSYDANGNLTTLGCSTFTYNAAGLPQEVVTPEGSASFRYSADGRKLACNVQYTPAVGDSASFTLTYTGNMIYRDGVPESVLFDGGYIDLTGAAPQYRFFVTDHLGSVRVVTDASGTPLRVNHYDPYGNDIQSTGSTDGCDASSRYRFCGKEWNSSAGLYDFGARIYDPFTASWLSPDPLAADYPGISPYAYCAGDPVNLVDPEGKRILIPGKQGKIKYHYGIDVSSIPNESGRLIAQYLNYIVEMGGRIRNKCAHQQR